ncbi:SDR family oxidoreductase [Deinococcus sp. SDU3-2]|uniref:SDR family oxidoreductase n=1 Tax=Deinococcus terrestris TaxID=2651870 RepID=A0A7X1TRG1_9DEIO|nr:SDR family oxidoreductase [Deinococcus terrestris]MPY66384.1 SDR family oxidoreductase [Deinococcus terrestris]
MNLNLNGKTALVTGAGSGIGQAVALAFAREGANVVLTDLKQESLDETVKLIEQANKDVQTVTVIADAGNPDDHQKAVDAAMETFGRLDAAVNNAGMGGEAVPVAEVNVKNWQKVLEVNLSGVFYGMQAQLNAMLGGEGGSIVNVASILGQAGWANGAAYVASKHGVVGLTRTAALDYAQKGVRVNAVGPGFIETPILGQDRQALDYLASLHPMGRLGKPEEIAHLIVFLSSPLASLITGAYYNADGGYLAK